jgi:hypothetical protein
MQVADNHDHDRLEEEAVRVGDRATATAFHRGWGHRESVDELDQGDKQSRLTYHHEHLHITFGLATAMMWGKAASGQAAAAFSFMTRPQLNG